MRNLVKLRRLIRIRERIREMRRSELARAQQNALEAQHKHNSDLGTLTDQSNDLVCAGEVDARAMQMNARLVKIAQKTAERSKDIWDAREDDSREHVHRVHLAQRDVKALERVETRVEAQQRKALLRQEQGLSDEKALRRAGGHE